MSGGPLGHRSRRAALAPHRGRSQRVVADIGDVAHFAEPHIGASGQWAGDDRAVVRFVFDVASEDVLEGVHEPALLMHKMHDAPDLHLPELFKEWMIHGLTATGILEGQANMGAPSYDLHVLVLVRSNTLIDLSHAAFKPPLKRC